MFEKIIEFFKSRKLPVAIQPKIEVDYHTLYASDDIKIALKEQWEALLKQLELDPSIIVSRKWSPYTTSRGEHHEEIILTIDGVVLNLQGPYYPDPNWVKPLREPIKSETERGNEAIDDLLQTTSMPWALTHCSDRKFEALLEFIKATRASREE